MKDIIKKYKKHRALSNIGIVSASLIIAMGFNFGIVDNTQLGQSLKANVLQSVKTTKKADIYLKKIGDDFVVKNSQKISQVSYIALSLAYNGENTSLGTITSDYGKVTEIKNEAGIRGIIINFPEIQDIPANINIIEFQATKKNDVETEYINIINANFQDGQETGYYLSASGTAY